MAFASALSDHRRNGRLRLGAALGRPVEEIRRVMRSGSRPHCVEGWTARAEPSAVLGTQSPNIESITSYLKTVLVFHA